MKSIKISDGSYVRLLKLKAFLTSINGKSRTFDVAVTELLDFWEENHKEASE